MGSHGFGKEVEAWFENPRLRWKDRPVKIGLQTPKRASGGVGSIPTRYLLQSRAGNMARFSPRLRHSYRAFSINKGSVKDCTGDYGTSNSSRPTRDGSTYLFG
jgi:hypothetical protein